MISLLCVAPGQRESWENQQSVASAACEGKEIASLGMGD